MKGKAAWPAPPASSTTITGMADLVFASSPILLPADRLIRANDLHPAARAGVDDQAKSVQFDDGRNQIEPKADAGRAANLVGAIESAQHRFMFLFADSWTRIRHAQDGLVLAAQQLELDAAAPGRELDSVVDEVGNRLQQQVPIAAHMRRARGHRAQRDLLVFGDRLVDVADLAQHFAQRNVAEGG